MNRSVFRWLMAVAAVLIFAGPATRAQSDPVGKKWLFELAPYFLWATNLNGDVSLRGTTAAVDAEFSDLFEQLDFIFDAHFEGRKGAWGFLVEPIYIDLEADFATAGPSGTAGMEMWIVEVSGIRSFGPPKDSIDLIFGARYMSLDAELDFSMAPTIGGDQDWTNAIVGVRFQKPLSEKWGVSLRGDIGAGDSDFTWNATALFIGQLGRRTGLVLGYRILEDDFETGSGLQRFAYDAGMFGPIVGLTFAF